MLTRRDWTKRAFGAMGLAFTGHFGWRALTRTYYVPDDFATIQEAIDSLADATVVVRPGMYRENLRFRDRAVRVQAEYPALEHRDVTHRRSCLVLSPDRVPHDLRGGPSDCLAGFHIGVDKPPPLLAIPIRQRTHAGSERVRSDG